MINDIKKVLNILNANAMKDLSNIKYNHNNVNIESDKIIQMQNKMRVP